MTFPKFNRFLSVGILLTLVLEGLVIGQIPERNPPPIPEVDISPNKTRAPSSFDKLSPELLTLYKQFGETTRGEIVDDGLFGFTRSQLTDHFGIVTRSSPVVTVAVRFRGSIDEILLKSASASVIARLGNVAYVSIGIKSLPILASSVSTTELGVFKTLHAPIPFQSESDFAIRPLLRGASTPTPRLANDFDKQRFTGKGVVIGVIDSGIDWRHDDFRNADGTSRIIAVWDLLDDSYQTSAGRIGTKPPVYLESSSRWLGTVYTTVQINSALSGTATVNTRDRSGHGTAVAGTAASNGRASGNGVTAGTYAGVAPEADLIVVRASDCGSFSSIATLTSEWIIDTARSVGKPVVVNMSFGGQFSTHDGNEEEERFLDSLVGPGKKGAVVTIAAGNEGEYSIRASNRFGPKRRGQADRISGPIEIQIKSPAAMLAVFDKSDDWGLLFRSSNAAFEGTDGKPAVMSIYRSGGSIECESLSAPKRSDLVAQFCSGLRLRVGDRSATSDTLLMTLPVGNYIAWGFGTGPNVPNGRFDIYSVEPASSNKAFFGLGVQKNGIVSSPGNAANAITVGSFDFRGSWVNRSGEVTFYNVTSGASSLYSSPGFRRDGVVKPDITAPARFTISPLSKDAFPDVGGCAGSMATVDEANITRDGYHLAWQGTSAATPFVTGVIALMLQKNPELDSSQIRSILKSTARSGSTVGSVPNPIWGWGMIDPAAAIRATPPRVKTAPARRR